MRYINPRFTYLRFTNYCQCISVRCYWILVHLFRSCIFSRPRVMVRRWCLMAVRSKRRRRKLEMPSLPTLVRPKDGAVTGELSERHRGRRKSTFHASAAVLLRCSFPLSTLTPRSRGRLSSQNSEATFSRRRWRSKLDDDFDHRLINGDLVWATKL